MIFNYLCSFGFLLCLLAVTNGQFNEERFMNLLALDCDEPSITLHVFSGTQDPVWKINAKQLENIKTIAYKIMHGGNDLSLYSKQTTRVMGYQGFTISCSSDKFVFVNGFAPLERLLLLGGRHHIPTTVHDHAKEHVGEIMTDFTYVPPANAGCNTVPIRGPDSVPKYDPETDDDGCFITKQTENNCYAYGTDIVTNTFPQPGRGSGQKWSYNTCDDMGKSSVRDGLILNGTTLPIGPPTTGHFAALLIWPDTNFHWIRMDVNGYWSHKPGGTPVRNTDNNGEKITDPSKSDFAPWTQFCAYYVAQPSKLQVN